MEDSFTKQYRRYYQTIEPVLVKPKNKLYSTVIFFLLVISLFAWYAIRPTVQTILYLQREIADKSKVNAQMDTKINALIEAQTTYEAIAEKIPTIAEALPDDPSVIKLLDQIKTIGLETNASVSAIQVGSSPLTQIVTDETQKKAVNPKKIPFELPITLTFNGTFPNILSFMQTLGSMRRLFRFESLSIAPNTTSSVGISTGSEKNLTVSVRMVTFFMKDK